MVGQNQTDRIKHVAAVKQGKGLQISVVRVINAVYLDVSRQILNLS